MLPMIARCVLPALAALLFTPGLAAQNGNACAAGPTGLVLSGGGAKGIAHIGVLRELDDRGIRPDMIVGTSMGAMIGAMYASGWSGADLDSLVRTIPASQLFGGHEPRGPVAWGALLPLVLWVEGERGFAIQNSQVPEAAVNGLLNELMLRGNLRARGDFDRLPTPLRVVATDMADRSVVSIAGGDLAQAVRASIAIPLVFTPQLVGERMLSDGGLSANIPVAVARSEGMNRLIVVDVTEVPEIDSLNLASPLVVADRLLNWLFRQPPDSLGDGDLLIRPGINGFRALDFSLPVIDSLIALGRNAAATALDGWNCGPGLAPPRTIVPLPRRVTQVVTADSNDASAVLLFKGSLVLDDDRAIDIRLLTERIRALAAREVFGEVWLGPGGSGDTLLLVPTLRRLPQRVAGFGLVYDTELGGKLWAGFLDRRVPVVNGEGSAILALGRFSQDLELSLRRQTILGQPDFSPVATLSFNHENVRRFDGIGVELAADDYDASIAMGGLERQLPAGFRLTVGGLLHRWEEVSLLTRVHSQHDAIGGQVVLEKLTASRNRLARGELTATDRYALAKLEIRFRGAFGPFRLEQMVRTGIGRDLPAGETFSLGGDEGFPGLHIGERRGDREAFTSLTLSRRVMGPLRLRVTGAIGRVVFDRNPAAMVAPDDGGANFVGRGILGSDGVLLGGRIGVGADTPVGPLRVEYGWNDAGREALFLRVGRWF